MTERGNDEGDERPDELPMITEPADLEELEGYKETIERFATIYYGTSRRIAAAINRLKGYTKK